jgi:hypothetical protein
MKDAKNKTNRQRMQEKHLADLVRLLIEKREKLAN